MTLHVGQPAPAFSLPTQSGEIVNLSGLKGKKVVLFFYPKDDTPGCTKENCEFRDLAGEFAKENALIFGISADDMPSHQAFQKKYQLNFPLLADTQRTTCKEYGVWGKQEWNGKQFEGIARTTFVIDEKGTLEHIYQQVNPVGHADTVLRDLKK